MSWADLSQFHFLRPQWLWLAATGVVVVLVSRWRDDPSRPWRGVIDDALLRHLLVHPRRGLRVRPVHLAAAFLVLAAIALAGPAWRKEAPPFAREKAPLAIAIDLSRSMDAIDIQPTRLERAKQKARDLVARRKGAKTVLLAYVGTAHLVLPLTDDQGVLGTYVEALSTTLLAQQPRDASAALESAEQALSNEQAAGTILFLTDGIPETQAGAFAKHARTSRNAVAVLGFGTSEGGPIRDGETFATDPSGRRLMPKLDRTGLQAVAGTGAFVATATLDDRDVERLQRNVQSHMEAVRAKESTAKYVDAGWYLAPLLAAGAGLCFRRGWTIRWAAAILLGFLASGSARAADWRFADLWATPDQQGRWLFERGDYAEAAKRFENPMWKGVACYRANDFACAIDQFARVDTPEAWFDLGNAYAKRGTLKLAVAAYDEALKRRPGWPEAIANRNLVASFILKPPKEDEEQEEAPEEKPDQVKFDEKGKKGKAGKVEVPKPSNKDIAEMWLRGVNTSPADFLRMKFAAQDEERKAKKGRAP
jgi:Ca-activated chloride channel family protein